jgi:hypothetical protein
MTIQRVFYIMLFIVSLSCPNSLSAQHKAKQDTIRFIQGNNVHAITNENDSITLGRQEFHIRFNALRYDPSKDKYTGLHLAVMEYPDDHIHPGTDVETLTYFRLGTGMANSDEHLLIIADEGHNYIIYQDEHEKRADLISRNGDSLLLDIDVRAFDVPVASELDYKRTKVKDMKIKDLWFIFWYDWNFNDKIDAGELKKVHVRFR